MALEKMWISKEKNPLLSSLFLTLKREKNTITQEVKLMVKIFIDPGHGGTDSGAVGNGLQEKNVTLQISSRIRDILTREYANVEVRLSRSSDQTLSLNQRTNMANTWGADFFLSVHINSGGGIGYEDFIHPSAGNTNESYQRIIHEEIMKQVDFVDRGIKKSDFHVLRESDMLAILTENGFIDNASDAAKLRNLAYLDRIARGHANGLARAFNLQTRISSSKTNEEVGDLPLRPGDTGDAVKVMNYQLASLGYISWDDRENNSFGNTSLNALRKFQTDQRIPVTGVYDATTSLQFAKILSVYYYRIRQNDLL